MLQYRNFINALLLSLLLLGSSHLGAEVTASFVSETGYDKGILWKVSSAVGKNSYLFGTIHVEDPRVTRLHTKVLSAIQHSKSMSLELIPDPQLQQKAMLAMLYTDGNSLQKVVGAKLYQRSIKAMSSHGMPEQVVSLMKPWAIMTMLSLPKPKTGEFLDKKLYKLAKQRGLKTYALENFEEQISVFDNLSRLEQIKMLKQTLDELSEIPAQLEALKNAWLNSDLALLESLSTQQLDATTSSNSKFKENMLDNRNKIMLERMQPRLDEGNAFIAVGALHLAGKAGLLNLLAQQGYTVTAVY
ncbi:MAG: TraB/GumN family protein [Sulfuriflexus sp.]|nr:TraB/GumN family protein [Sulfuriflexus sp.]